MATTAVDLMKGFPPAPEGQVTLANWRKPPFNRWGFLHAREIVPSADIANDPWAIRTFPERQADLSSWRLDFEGASYGFEEFLAETNTDGLAILKDGALVCESYRAGVTRASPHILMSVSKSVLGLLAGILAEKGVIDLAAPVAALLPEVARTGYAGASLRDLLDMRVGIHFDEDYTATSGPIIEYRKAQGWDPLGPGETPSDLRSFFSTMTQSDGRHGDLFHYVSPNTDLLGWAFERAAGRRYADLVSELLWQPMGAERSAYITVDRLGAPRCAGGFCATTRDLARLGQLVSEGGSRDGRQIIPAAWIDDITHAGDASAWDRGDFAKYFPGAPVHYRSKWYVLRGKDPMLFGVGVHGQNVFIDPTKRLVIAKVSSQASAMDERRIRLTSAAVEALRQHFGSD